MAENAATRRLLLLQEMYRDAFPNERHSGTCLWLVEEDGEKMVNALVETEDTPGAVFDAMLVTLRSPFNGRDTYATDLADELWNERILAGKEELIAAGVDPVLFDQPPRVRNLNDLFLYFRGFVSALPNPCPGVAIYLWPLDYKKPVKQWVTWLEESLQQNLPDHCVLLLHDRPDGLLSTRLARRKDLKVSALTPDLKMDELAAELAAEGDPNDPEVQFRQLFLKLSEAGQRGDFERMKAHGQDAQNLAEQQTGWEHIVVSVLAAQGSHLLSRKGNQAEAITYFEQARNKAELAIELENPAGPVVLIQTLNFLAAAHFHHSEYDAATEYYLEVAQRTEQAEDQQFIRMEAFRMAAFCQRLAGKPTEAWENNLLSLVAAEGLDENIRFQSTLPYVGRELMTLMEILNRYSESRQLKERLNRLAGPDWESKISEAETPAAL
ncbi:MAG: hypothetical protein AAGF87_18080 [Bacteroidota bacterium]